MVQILLLLRFSKPARDQILLKPLDWGLRYLNRFKSLWTVVLVTHWEKLSAKGATLDLGVAPNSLLGWSPSVGNPEERANKVLAFACAFAAPIVSKKWVVGC